MATPGALAKPCVWASTRGAGRQCSAALGGGQCPKLFVSNGDPQQSSAHESSPIRVGFRKSLMLMWGQLGGGREDPQEQ